MGAEVAVVGGGLGGVAAALALLQRGRRVVLTEEYAWLGGQLTSQAAAPDEHSWAEQLGGTARYRNLREKISQGRGRVGKPCHEPRVAEAAITELLAPYRSSGRLTVLQPAEPVAAEMSGAAVRAVTVRNPLTEAETEITAGFFVDATEAGDLLPLTGTAYAVGAEARSEHGEPSAPEVADPADVQPIAWCFGFDHVDGDHTIERPRDYDLWRSFELPFEDGFAVGDVVLANWPQLGYVGGSAIDFESRPAHFAAAKAQARAYFYWLQTEAPRPDGGHGWPGLRLRGDLVGTDDGFAQAPYIRESRRIKALTTIREQDLSGKARGDAGFAVPLGALIPVVTQNLLPAGKNIGTTHITSDAYRPHPVEWNIGEAAGELAAFCLDHGLRSQQVATDPELIHQYQTRLAEAGVELHRPEIAR
ncbi:FAD-dependent oxidoreductase [Kribbella sandramycini]|uniref:FAD-dependent oxidoreductase n=1 Tax=Kribbella sandramycini TaxID=60450 RepID=A0A7Y4KXA4_9ACTN|nr:FAD-dependent oxidoreductase [Kribbella sandramycini]